MSNEFAPISVGLMGTIGVVGITMFDLRRHGKVSDIVMAGTNGGKFPEVREHFKKNIGDVYKGLDLNFRGFPEGNVRDAEAYKTALRALPKGSAVIIFTPDSTHFPIASEALNLGHHVMVTKPATQKLEDHQTLIDLAAEKGLVCWVEHHKRFDPAYNDARARAQNLGDFNFYQSYMSQPKFQLETFKSWAGIDSDISYYLNSHHIDIHCWMVEGKYRPTRVTASASKGIATGMGCDPRTEDTITLLVDWVNIADESKRGTAVYTASWAAPLKAGVHSNQRFHYMASEGEIEVDQAHRGYSVVEDATGKSHSTEYSADEDGFFDARRGYGYVSLEKFIDAARNVNAGVKKASDYEGKGLPTIQATVLTTAIIQAGRISLDERRTVEVLEENGKYKLK
ncbi:uncharacterized protein EHS24_007098 [Apiotrichum porosum]|uniref:Gfo/Idh/MocA-like oxidoreductase N-terminal domain-containing protein n=1 Tax=Apiotrichum porosum TaxID=105984 RepID=A0A427XX27_9TREE|nr:uncharacterized protein EHS24_007098 [Apiotrichum porosum]RSH83414.1 hypothetical protein EHS24_007098 [Apiotrichum porosum]